VPPSRDEIEPENKRRRILAAAHEICERCGVEGARMDDVAALARVSKGTLYNFFDNKQDLLLAAMIDSYEESLRLLEPFELGPEAGDLEVLDQFLDGMARVLEAMAPRMTVHYQAWGLVAGDETARARLYGFLVDFFQQRSKELVVAIRDAQQNGAFAPDTDADAITDGITAMLGGFLYRATFDASYADPARLQACFDAQFRKPFYLHPKETRHG
jgi:AcrR family transcriptional regulator